LHPEELLSCCGSRDELWLSLGLFNLVLATRSASVAARVVKLAAQRDVGVEIWRVRDGIVRGWNLSRSRRPPSPSLDIVTELADKHLAPELTEALAEYCPLFASTMARSWGLPTDMVHDLEGISNYVKDMLVDSDKAGPSGSPYQMLAQLVWVNAGLSHFSSQALSGIGPIVDHECQFRSNSLLGIGIPVLGLWRLCGFLRATLGAARIPARVSNFRKFDEDVPDLPPLIETDGAWSIDYLARAQDTTQNDEPLVPVIAYFSARDGFSSMETTISAPLACVASCNSVRWSLMTLTHEISHIVIRGVLAKLYPDLASDREVRRVLGLLSNTKSSNLLEEIRRFLTIGVVMMDRPGGKDGLDEESLRTILVRRKHECEELLVHVFDFLYFYGREVDKYVSGIWASWGVIPNISSRIREYVLRTICTVLVKHLRRGEKAEECARNEVRRALKRLQEKGLGGEYVASALSYIDRHWNDELRDSVRNRRPIVQIAQTFLFSKNIATPIRSETQIVGGERETEGYDLRVGRIDPRKIRNPLRFVEYYTRSKTPTALESAWMFYILAFCLDTR
jgi:hypothetical protein